MAAARSDTLVFFGASGDLGFKQIFPALQALIRRGNLDMPIIGVAKSGWDLDQLKQRVRESLEAHGSLDPAAYARLCSRLRYIDGDYRDPATFAQLREMLGSARRPLHYLAVPPSLFAKVAEGLAQSGCARDARVVVEKPFGRDLASARELDRTLRRFFSAEAIFHIDHYLGKEPIQNLLYFRFANPIIEATWDRHHLESVQITMAERFGVAGRGKFYEEVGAIRDVVQNHMLQVVACLAMERPAAWHQEALRDERERLLRKVRTLTPPDVVRGQFAGYRQEPGVTPDSQVETFAAVRFHIDSDRWAEVPFHVRAGKCLPVTATEVLVRLKRLPRSTLDESASRPNGYYRFRISPEAVLALGVKVKRPGERMEGEEIELIAHHQPPDEIEPYERLLEDASNGDATLFARMDSIETAWRIVDPILGDATPLFVYQPGTWGPPEADRILPSRSDRHDPDPPGLTTTRH